MKPTLDFVKEIAAQAGDILQEFVGQDLAIDYKCRTDLVTVADRASEAFLINAIRENFLEHTIIAEESGHLEGDLEHQWFIDPLDGTLNFAHGVPFYCVSIGYAYRGQMVLGVVYDPVREEIFCAENQQGASLNGRPIQVAGFTELVACMLVTGFSNDLSDAKDDNTENYIRFNSLAQSVRRMGSAALDFVYVAAGRLDGIWEVAIHPWDVAAGGLIVREAGGVVTNVYGEHDFMQKPVSLVAANPTIHQEMLDVLADVRKAQSAG